MTLVDPPVVEIKACTDYDTKYKSDDIGAAAYTDVAYWCDKGRVFECVETADSVDGTRPNCSAYSPTTDKTGSWQLVQAASEVAAIDVAAFDAWFGDQEEFADTAGTAEDPAWCFGGDDAFAAAGAWDTKTLTTVDKDAETTGLATTVTVDYGSAGKGICTTKGET